MNKSTLVGGGAGLLVLALLAAFWFSASAPETPLPAAPAAPTAPGAVAAPSAAEPSTAPASAPAVAPFSSPNASQGADGNAAPSSSAPWNAAQNAPQPSASPEQKTLNREERRAIRAQVRAKMSELLAKGPNASAGDTQAFLNDVEQLGQGMFDPRYFSTMREMVEYSAQTQALSDELGKIASSTATKDVERKQEILGEMRELGDRISNGAASLQSYARDTVAGETP